MSSSRKKLKTEKCRVPDFTSERDEIEKIMDNYYVSEVGTIGMRVCKKCCAARTCEVGMLLVSLEEQ